MIPIRYQYGIKKMPMQISKVTVLMMLIFTKSPMLIKFIVNKIKTAGTSCGRKIISHEKYNANSGANGFIPMSTAT